MPWPQSSLLQTREALVLAMLRTREPVSTLCRRFGIARSCAYKWLARYRAHGRAGLLEHSRRPPPQVCARTKALRGALVGLRRRHPYWGAAKLRPLLQAQWPRQRLPAERTLARWLQQAGLVHIRVRRARRGPPEPKPKRRPVRRANDVWTIDFKGWFRAGDGTRIEPLTVRDLHSRFILAITLLADQSEAAARRALRRVFARFGLPRAIRCDQGAPFGSRGPRGLTRLSAWWRQLGIAVEFGRRAHPEDNAGHEQMHAVYQREVAADPGPTRACCQRRTQRWLQIFNHQRPHQALNGRVPAQRYRPSSRSYPARLSSIQPPRGVITVHVNPKGYVPWLGRQRLIGRAFAKLCVFFRPHGPRCWAIYHQHDLLGLLYQDDRHDSIRPVQLTL